MEIPSWLGVRGTPWSWAVPVVAFLAGLLLALSSSASQGRELRSAAVGLPDLIRAKTLANERRAVNVAQLQSQVDALTVSAAPADKAIASLRSQADALSPAAGLTAVTGPAVQVTLRDSTLPPDQLPPGYAVDDLVIHQQDVEAVVNALWSAGAEAMMIQDQRVISTSAVRCVGNTLILKGRVYSPPFVVAAIGDTTRLQRFLDTDPTLRIFTEHVRAIGLGYDVAVERKASFPAYTGTLDLGHTTVTR